VPFVFLLFFMLPVNLVVSMCESKLKVYNHVVLLLYVILGLCFIVGNIVLFFVLFEFMVIVMFLLLYSFILSYYRLRSSYWFFVYSLIGSFSMIVGIISLVGAQRVVSYSSYVLVLLTILMCIKIPTFPFNFWLIEVHAEANTSLSLVLAALMLKVGVFGLLKYC